MTTRRRSARLTGRGRVRGKATAGKPSSAVRPAAGTATGAITATGTLAPPPVEAWLQTQLMQADMAGPAAGAPPLTATASPAGSVQATGVIWEEPMAWVYERLFQEDMHQ
jgi:hypothetical protein